MKRNPPLAPGLEPIPGYRLVQLRGKGGYAEVWEAENSQGQHLALKFLSGFESRSLPREIKAIEIVRQLRHPNLVRIDQVLLYQSSIVVVMELAECSLFELLQVYQEEFKQPIILEQVCLLFTQVAEALDFLNTRQHHVDGKTVAVQHCDVKPSNMLLFGDVVKLTDFGLSSVISSSIQGHRKAGTLDYAAPEVFQGRLSDHTDQYALAVSYCELRSGRLPFADTPTSFRSDYVRPAPDLSMLTDAERPILAKALAPAPQDRWRSCGQFIDQINMLIA